MGPNYVKDEVCDNLMDGFFEELRVVFGDVTVGNFVDSIMLN